MTTDLTTKVQYFPVKEDAFFDVPDHIRKKIELWRQPYFEFLFGFEAYLRNEIPDWYSNGYKSIFHWGLFSRGGSQSTIMEDLGHFVEHSMNSGIFDFRLSTPQKCIFKATFTGIDYVSIWFDKSIDVFFPEMRRKYSNKGVSVPEFVQIITTVTPFFAQIIESDAVGRGY